MDDLTKLAQDVPGIVKEASDHMRKLAAQNVELAGERDAAVHELRLMKLARRMEQRGLESALSYEDKVASLRDVPSTKLATLESAVELAAGGFRLGQLSTDTNKTASEGAPHGELYRSGENGSDTLDDFILSQQAQS